MPRLFTRKHTMTVTEKTIPAAVETKIVAVAPAAPVATTAPVAATKVAAKPAVKRVAKKPAAPAPVAVKAVVKTVTKPVAKAAPKAAAKPAVKAAPKAAAKPAVKAVAKPKAEKLVKPKKPKLVRDSFTIPKVEYTVLDDLKQRAGKLASAVKKSELIRAGVKALAAMSDAAFLAALKVVPTIKTGRPTKAKVD